MNCSQKGNQDIKSFKLLNTEPDAVGIGDFFFPLHLPCFFPLILQIVFLILYKREDCDQLPDKVNETGSTCLKDTKEAERCNCSFLWPWACWWRTVFPLTVQLLALIFSTPAHLLLYHSKEGSLLSYLNAAYLWGTLSEKPLIYDLSARNT